VGNRKFWITIKLKGVIEAVWQLLELARFVQYVEYDILDFCINQVNFVVKNFGYSNNQNYQQTIECLVFQNMSFCNLQPFLVI
jgi:hypothetical protein